MCSAAEKVFNTVLAEAIVARGSNAIPEPILASGVRTCYPTRAAPICWLSRRLY